MSSPSEKGQSRPQEFRHFLDRISIGLDCSSYHDAWISWLILFEYLLSRVADFMLLRAGTTSLFSLPVDVMRCHVLPYLYHDELSMLDRACLNHCFGQREYMLEAFDGLYLDSNLSQEPVTTAIARWVIQRGMFFSSLHLTVDSSDIRDFSRLFSRCGNLTSLYLKLNKVGFDCISLFQDVAYYSRYALKLLDVSGYGFVHEFSVLPVVEECSSLRYLNLSDCVESLDCILDSLGRCNNSLKSLRVANCRMSDASLRAFFEHSPELVWLELAQCDVSDNAIVALAESCPNLQVLDLGGSFDISDRSLLALSEKCPRLKSLDISCCNITDESVHAVSQKCRDLKKLVMSDCSFLSAEIFVTMPHGLLEVNLSDCWGVKDLSLQHLLAGCPLLETLNLENCVDITDAAFGAVAGPGEAVQCGGGNGGPFPPLKSLVLNGCRHITDRTLFFLRHGSHADLLSLQHLEVEGCVHISDAAMCRLLECSPPLTHLNVNRCTQIQDNSLLILNRYCVTLEVLKVSGCYQITDNSLGPIFASCKQLCSVDISGCYHISDSTLLLFTSDLGMLHFDASDCPRITDKGLSVVIGRSPHLSFLSIGTTAPSTIVANERFSPSINAPRKRNTKTIATRGSRKTSTSEPKAWRSRPPRITAHTFAQLEKCPALTVLRLHGAIPDLTDECLTRTLMTFTNIEELDISGSSLITDAGLSTLASLSEKYGPPSLRDLNISGLDRITSSSINLVTEAIGTSLQRLDVSGCRRLTDDAFAAIAFNCRSLEHLNLAGCILVTNATPDALSRTCRELQSIDMSYCFSISSLRDFVVCHNLQTIVLRKVDNVTFLIPEQDILFVQYNCPELDVLQL